MEDLEVQTSLYHGWMGRFVATLLLFCTSQGFAELFAQVDLQKDFVQMKRLTSLNWEGLIPLKNNKTPKAAGGPKIKVMIDPGHGGKDLGAISPLGIIEKDLCLRVATLTKRALEKAAKYKNQEIEVQLSRTEDKTATLGERVTMANQWGADAFISIHANSSESPKPQGFEVYFLSAEATDKEASRIARIENKSEKPVFKSQVLDILNDAQVNWHRNESSQLAETVYVSMSTRFLPKGRGIRQGPFTVLHGTLMPAVLVEVGYLTNPEEAMRLTKLHYLKRLANAISGGIIDYLYATKKLS